MDPLVAVLVVVGCVFLILACYGWGQPRVDQHIERWSKCINGLSEPADLFYARVYQRLKERLNEASLPDSKIGFGPGHLFGNGTIFGARPRYLVIRYADTVVYLYAYPLPSGLFVSYWTFSKFTLWLEHPVLKYFAKMHPSPVTLYRFNVMELCLTVIHSAIYEVIDEYSVERGLKPLEEHERRPILQSFYARYKQGALPTTGYVMPVQSTPFPPVMPLPPSGSAPSGPSPLPPTPTVHGPAPADA